MPWIKQIKDQPPLRLQVTVQGPQAGELIVNRRQMLERPERQGE